MLSRQGCTLENVHVKIDLHSDDQLATCRAHVLSLSSQRLVRDFRSQRTYWEGGCSEGPSSPEGAAMAEALAGAQLLENRRKRGKKTQK